MDIDLYKRQEQLELQSRTLTIQRFENSLTEKVQTNQEAATYYGSALMKRTIDPLSKAIETFIKEANSGAAGRRHSAVKFLEKFDTKLVAYLSARTIIDKLSDRAKLQTTAVAIATALEDELRFQQFEKEKPFLFKKVLNEATDNQRRRRTNLIGAYNRYCSTWSSWSQQDKLHVGMKLIDLFNEVTGFIEIFTQSNQKNRTDLVITPSASVCAFIEKNREAAAMLSPAYMPMIVPPTDWTGPRGGGYLTHYVKPLTLIKTTNRNYLDELEEMPEQMADVYSAINAIQRTPWRINAWVLSVFQVIHDQGLHVGGLPSQETIPLPQSPLAEDRDTSTLSDDERVEFKAWKKRALAVYEENIRLKSKRLMVSKIRSIAEQFAPYSQIFYPHTMDFRGRIYPAPNYLTPQGNSLSKGLLEFADGKPLGSNEAACELAIHGANCFGYDKASMQERVDWVVERSDRICQVAEDPFADLWWAKEADDPWCFLAFCREWAGYCENGYDHVSYIPVAKDGSCSGLQHLSGALRDPEGGRAVNLVPSDRPADIYQTVINKTIEKVKADLGGENGEIAQRWLDYGMTRKTAKRTTMTRVYGSTLYSARAFVQEYIMETDSKRKQENLEYVSPLAGIEFDAAVYLAQHVWSSINETVIAAKDGMDWLQSCARVLTKEKLPIVWTTVDGLPVMQRYPDMTKRRVKTKMGDQLVYLTLNEENHSKLDSRRQGNGISPNWVHANDACHLRMTVNLASFNGVTHFAMIHDSFGCHASDVEMLGACLRETFVDLYVNHDPLSMFKQEGEAFAKAELPDLPAKGDLDVSQVLGSEFFFA